jgi:glycosyltransferase involved in cell wall biosynthesis
MMDGGVIEAQVIASLRAHSKIKGQPKTRLIFLEPARVAFGSTARKTLKAYRRMWPDGDIKIVPFVSRLGASSPGKFLAAYLFKERLASSDIVFHCRGPAATLSAHVARQILGRGRVIFDVRGAHADETIHRMGFPWATNLSQKAAESYRLSKECERSAAQAADYLFTVSSGLKAYAVEELDASEDHILVVPSCIEEPVFDEEKREEARREWGIVGDAPVFIYSGRLGPERLPDHMFRVFRAVLRIRPDAKMILLSYLNQLDDLKSFLSKNGIPENAVKAAGYPRDEALKRLCAADIALLFLEPAQRFNQFAAPIKVAEYFASGLPIIVNESVGNIPALVSGKDVGWVINQGIDDASLDSLASEVVAGIERDQGQRRKRCLDVCSEFFLWRNYIPAVRRVYGISGD